MGSASRLPARRAFLAGVGGWEPQLWRPLDCCGGAGPATTGSACLSCVAEEEERLSDRKPALAPRS